MKKIIITALFVSFLFASFAQTTPKTYYLSTNLLSPLAGLNKNSAAANALLPLLSNLEYGATLSGGYFKNYHSLETRLTLGKSNQYNFIPQLQLAYHFFVLDYLKKNQSGWYIGGASRYWLYHNKYTKTNLNNLTLNMSLGYAWKKNRFFYDVRVNQPLTIFTSSSIENTKGSFEANFSPMPELSPVLPFLSINIGYQFKTKTE